MIETATDPQSCAVGGRADVLSDRRAESLVARLEAHVGRDAVLCSDGDGAYGLFARRRAMPHYRLHPKTGPRIIDTAFHIQTVNNLRSRFESFMKLFCGPATKNLPGYAAWFIQTLKENLLWIRTFRTVEELRIALIDFRRTYNVHWLIERYGHRPPAQFRRDQMDTIPLAA